MVAGIGLLRNCVVVCVVACFTASDTHAQFVPGAVKLNGNAGNQVLPPAVSVLGDVLRGEQVYMNELGAAYRGQAEYLRELGAYEALRQETCREAQRNLDLKRASNREWRKQCDADRQALGKRRSSQNNQTDLRHFRDQPDSRRMTSGASLNYLLKQFGPNLTSVDFARVSLTPAELASIRLQTRDGVTSDGLDWCFDRQGKIRWPEELRLVELSSQRDIVESAVSKLRQLDRQQVPAQTQVKRVLSEISKLRSLAGNVSRVQKNDEIGADASRTFLKHLDCQIAKLPTNLHQDQLRQALRPDVRSAEELMRHVARHDLRFAPADDPTATAYLALHECLAQSHRDQQQPSPSLHAAK